LYDKNIWNFHHSCSNFSVSTVSGIDLTCSTNFTKLFIENGDIGKIQYELQFSWNMDAFRFIRNNNQYYA